MKLSPAKMRVLSAALLLLFWNTQTLTARAAASEGAGEAWQPARRAARQAVTREVVTREFAYATCDGLSPDAKPAFKLYVKSLENAWDPAVRARVRELFPSRGRTNGRPGGKAAGRGGEKSTEQSDGFSVSLSGSRATYHADLASAELAEVGGDSRIPEWVLLAATAGIMLVAPESAALYLVTAAGSVNVLTDIVEADTEHAEHKAAGRIVAVGSDGRMFPTKYSLPPTDCEDMGCLGGYIYRDVFTPHRPSRIAAFAAGLAFGEFAGGAFGRVFPKNPKMKVMVGEFSSSVADSAVAELNGYAHYDVRTGNWVPSALTVRLQSIERPPAAAQAPPQPAAATVAPPPPQLTAPRPVPTQHIAPTQPVPLAQALTPIEVRTYTATPSASALAVSPVSVTTTSVFNTPSAPPAANSKIPKAITLGDSFGSYRFHY